MTTTAPELEKATLKLWNAYLTTTSTKLKLIDAFLVFIMISGIIQFIYCVAISNFPYNAFLAGFASCVGMFVLTANLRIQVNKANEKEFETISAERAFADFVFCGVVLHCFVVNFLG